MAIKLIDDWKRGWKFYSAWFYLFLAALPDLYNAAATMGWTESMADAPGTLKWAIRGLAFAGLVSRFVKQTRPAEPDDTDTAGA